MADISAPVAVASAPKKAAKKSTAGPTKPKSKPTHPPTAIMVNAAIKSLKERGGSSLSAIKKYLATNYKVDVEKFSPFIKKYLKSSVTSGILIQTKGKGATGSFKLAAAEKKVKGEKKPKVAKKTAEKKVKKTAAKKVAKTAKKTGTIKTKAPKEKSLKKTTKVIKTKAPKPKKAAKSA